MNKRTIAKGSTAAAAVIATGALALTVSGAFASDDGPSTADKATTVTTDNAREPLTPASKGVTVGVTPMGKGTHSPPISTFPDFVEVIGNHGKEGYAESAWLYGEKGGPKNPKQAIRWQKNGHHKTIPVYTRAGKEVDRFTIY